ncbi:DNA-processing protein DprA [Corynebacterium caspium]|uniref:DNA-processing protein DprA n=1 Tax=Corynebacterium caspium TaxID=234828 RepID=UPI000361D839|nr:DNA-processing protein DprA [Corynebacterium caspium]WKD59064.1 hypothetical protein CCASP_03300 [Corynebacterium caspium DSM 44850]
MTTTNTELRAWAYLSRVIEGPSRTLNQLLDAENTAVEIAHGIFNRREWVGDLLRETASRYHCDNSQEDLSKAAAQDIRLIYPGHSEWPTSLFDRAFGFAATGLSPHLRTYQADAVAPHVLWLKGNGNLPALTAQAVAIVGSRAVTRYGQTVTKAIATGLAQHQWTIISGGAVGVDSVAHRTVLAMQKPTIAIAACGLDFDYPASNRKLFNEIVKDGLQISEYPPGRHPQRHRFLTRNRLVAALSQGVVATQAAWRSGALNTLSWAEGLGRMAMAVPGPITESASLGCHARIRNGSAQLVSSADEIRGLLTAIGTLDIEEQFELQFSPTPIQGLSHNELRVYDAVSPDRAADTQTIAQESGLTLTLTIHLLVELQQKNLITLERGKWRKLDT